MMMAKLLMNRLAWSAFLVLMLCTSARAQEENHSVARLWNEAMLEGLV